MSNWGYVAIAYTVVWGSLALYALLLARRVSQARKLAQQLREAPPDPARQSFVAPDSSRGQQPSATNDSGLATGD